MEDSIVSFGLAPVKREGERVHVDVNGKWPEHEESSKKRYIEMLYDPKDDSPVDSVRFAIQDHIAYNKLSDDEVRILIANIANEFIEENGC